jgi:hypothetical protein
MAAAQLLALDPTLTLERMVRILTQTGRPVVEVPDARSIDPQRAVELIRGSN